MGQFGRTLSFGSSGRFKFRIPVLSPRVEDDHAVNWRALKEQWDALPLPYRFGVSVRRSTNITVPHATAQKITWTTAPYDENKFWSGGGSTTELKVPPGGAGLYVAWCHCRMDENTGLNIIRPILGLNLNDVPSDDIGYFEAPTPARIGRYTLTTPIELNDGDRISWFTYHESGADRVLQALDPGSSPGGGTAYAFQARLYRVAIYG